ncbi:ribosome small subunit-dependent GTPase A [Tetragenococcus halophilus]|uniref:ribosome small subunit-dependent GTPase A n=1 Tax=Tetragenococcus halophilus TaxID=51669 RepID=UPI001F1F5BA1|nr:ribosome small subunit-dependent GTPase A [Tetragenococcus halophilus]MCF1686234.1 ribosome small subunit-dependent GTPase A [Tetragenococcus halophilus]
MKGQIQKALSGFYYIYSEGEIYQTRARGNFRNRKITPLVGDYVVFESENLTEGYLLEILPRKNQLLRPPVANVDQSVIVISLTEPQFSYFLLDRFLVSIEYEDIEPIIYLSKADLSVAPELIEEIATTYRKIGYTVIISTEEKAMSNLQNLFPHRLTVFTGQSGAGKSALLNRLMPQLNLATAEISDALGRGRHTTRHVELLPAADGLVADTPGFSAINFSTITERELAKQFPEFVQASSYCRFRECLHLNEPDCEVKRQVETNDIAKSRYDNYVYFLDEIKNRKPVYKKKR